MLSGRTSSDTLRITLTQPPSTCLGRPGWYLQRLSERRAGRGSGSSRSGAGRERTLAEVCSGAHVLLEDYSDRREETRVVVRDDLGRCLMLHA